MNTYRIIIETEISGKSRYYVQKKTLFYWLYFRQVRDISMYAYKVMYNTIAEAEDAILLDVANECEKKQQEIAEKKVLKTIKLP